MAPIETFLSKLEGLRGSSSWNLFSRIPSFKWPGVCSPGLVSLYCSCLIFEARPECPHPAPGRRERVSSPETCPDFLYNPRISSFISIGLHANAFVSPSGVIYVSILIPSAGLKRANRFAVCKVEGFRTADDRWPLRNPKSTQCRIVPIRSVAPAKLFAVEPLLSSSTDISVFHRVSR